ncbi:MAG: Fic family protein [Roseivirga sp.]|jgi:Fic family protein
MSPLEKAAILFEELNALRPFSSDDEQRIMQKFRLDWNYHSNHIEGNQLTYGETKALLLFNITAQGKTLKDHIEMTGHNEAINWIIDVLKDERPLTENFIRQIHTLLLKEPYEVDAITPEGKPTKRTIQVGQYKSAPNHVLTKTGEIFRFASVEETPAKMNDLLDWYKEEKGTKDKNAIILAAEFHYKFIRIHPFDDGNGRLARILMNFILMSKGYPPVVIKTEDKENYFNVLQLADAGQFTPFVEYITANLNHSLELMIKGAKGEDIEEEDDLEKEIVLLTTKIKGISAQREKQGEFNDKRSFARMNLFALVKEFEKKMNIFSKLYNKTEFRLFSDLGRISSSALNAPLDIDIITGDGVNILYIDYSCKSFIVKGADQISFRSQYEIRFKPDEVLIRNSVSKIHISFPYNHTFQTHEIEALIKPELLRHKNMISEFVRVNIE